MKISVVIPLYNKERSVLRSINSVLSQSEQDFELIVVNDGSTDGSAALVANLAENQKIRLIDQKNAGASAARNKGVNEARSELIAFLDADDEWHPEFLQTILELRSEFPSASVFSTSYFIKDKTREITSPNITDFFTPGYRGFIDNYLGMLRYILPFNNSSFAVTKKAFQEVGGFPVGIKFGEDVDTWIRLSIKNKMVHANRSLVIYHHDAENRACDLYYPSLNQYYPVTNLVEMMKAGKIPTHLRHSAIEYIAKYQLDLAKTYLYHGDPGRARTFLRSCSGTKIYKKEWFVLYCCTFIPPASLVLLIKVRNVFRDRLS